jgi:hypothetical protein
LITIADLVAYRRARENQIGHLVVEALG